jgi:hypothetical protein
MPRRDTMPEVELPLVVCTATEAASGFDNAKIEKYIRSVCPSDMEYLSEALSRARQRVSQILGDIARLHERHARARRILADRQLALDNFRKEPQAGSEWARCLATLQRDVEVAELDVSREAAALEQPEPQKRLAALKLDLEQAHALVSRIVARMGA